MLFEIDVSGQDILSGDYAIAVANNDKLVYGFRFTDSLVFALNNNYNLNKFRYQGNNEKVKYKIRLYSIAVYYIFKRIIKENFDILQEKITLNICRDFSGHENDIKSNFEYFLKEKLKLNIANFNYCRLPHDSNADRYAYIFRKDTKNIYQNLIKIKKEEFEEFLKKK